MKIISIFRLKPVLFAAVFLLATGLLMARQNDESETEGPEQKRQIESAEKNEGGYIFQSAERTGGGGGAFVLYGNGTGFKDVVLWGGRGYALLNDRWRIGGLGAAFKSTKAGHEQKAGGMGGLMLQHLWRFDPVIVGAGLTLGGAGFGETYEENGVEKQRGDGYFFAYPQLELEVRFFKNVSMSVLGGYTYFKGRDSAPDISNANIGIAFTFGKF